MRHADQVQGYLSRHCGSWNIIEEVTQEVLCGPIKAAAKFRGESSVRTWLIGIARNALREATRQRSKHLITLETRLAELTPTIDDDEHASSDHDEQAFSALSEPPAIAYACTAPVTARYQDGTPLPELARNYKKKATALARQLQRLAASFATAGANEQPNMNEATLSEIDDDSLLALHALHDGTLDDPAAERLLKRMNVNPALASTWPAGVNSTYCCIAAASNADTFTAHSTAGSKMAPSQRLRLIKGIKQRQRRAAPTRSYSRAFAYVATAAALVLALFYSKQPTRQRHGLSANCSTH